MDYNYKKAGTIFNAHSYWTKQPVEVVQSFIEKYSAPNDIVLDPFCGTGMTGVASIITGRRYLLSDISPTCIHISKGYCNPLSDTQLLKDVLNKVTKKIERLYKTDCPVCRNKCDINYCILTDNFEINGKLRFDRIVFNCVCCGKKIEKNPSASDVALFNCKDHEKYNYPKEYFFGQEPKRNYRKGIKQVYQLYSRRNLTALLELERNIKNIKDKKTRTTFMFAFTSIVFNCSLMSRYNELYKNTQIRMGTFYIPKHIKDNNVVSSFKRKLNAIIKSQELIFQKHKSGSGEIILASATDMSRLKDASVDYIYTDPPYSDKISYSELNIVYESWLANGYTDTTEEMIVSKAGGKSAVDYTEMFRLFLREAFRVLKQDKYITLVFHNSNVEHWSLFQDTIIESGFTPVVSKLPNRLISKAKTSTQYQSTKISKCFMAFTLKKTIPSKNLSLIKLDEKEYIKNIKNIKKMAVECGYITPSDQYDFVINSMIYKYKILGDIEL